MNANQLPEIEVNWFLAVGKALGFNFRLEPDFAAPQNAYDILNGRDELLYTVSALVSTEQNPQKFVLEKWALNHTLKNDGFFMDAHAMFERIIYEQVDDLMRWEHRNLQEPER